MVAGVRFGEAQRGKMCLHIFQASEGAEGDIYDFSDKVRKTVVKIHGTTIIKNHPKMILYYGCGEWI